MLRSKLLILFALLIIVWAPTISFAALGTLPFAGLVTFVVPCTCTGGLWIQFSPFYPGGGILLPIGALTFRPIPIGPSIPYADLFVGVIGTLHAGDYFPTPGTCWIGEPPFCAPLPDFGVIFQVGTNRLGF
ncbi:MAG TPA: hypothetical protein VJJ27_01710 [Candidatus Paceibacterota bacterium]